MTIELSTQDFIDTLFEGKEDEELVCVTKPISFKDKDTGKDVNTFVNRRTRSEDFRAFLSGKKPADWYVCISSVTTPEGEEKLKRGRTHIKFTYCIVLDDVGTKVKAKDIKLEPSWKMETSNGNQQWGYLIVADDRQAKVEFLINELIRMDLSDPGAIGVYRVVRVPGSVNMKPKNKKFKSRLVEWTPERIWDLEDLAKEFGVDLENIKERQRDQGVAAKVDLSNYEDPVLKWLKDQDKLGEDNGKFFKVECPWHHLHTNKNDDSTGYSPIGHGEDPSTRYFNCFHGSHGGDGTKNTSDFLSWVADQDFGPDLATDGDPHLEETRRAAVIASLPPSTTTATQVLPFSTLPDLVTTANGLPRATQKATVPNIMAVSRSMGLTLAFNVMTREVEIEREGRTLPNGERALLDVLTMLGIDRERTVRDVVSAAAQYDSYHPMEEWLEDQEWDGDDHISALSKTVFLREDQNRTLWEYYLRRWLIQCVEAACGWRKTPPTQKAGVLLICGPQNRYKTRWLIGLAPHFSREGVSLHLNRADSKDSMTTALTRTIVELGELETTLTKSDSGALKNFLSRAEDTYRMPYAAREITSPRTTSFCASVNEASALLDETGSRRFWPIVVDRADPTYGGLDMNQLWAQTHHLWKKGEVWWLNEIEEDMRIKDSAMFQQASESTDALSKMFGRTDLPDKIDWRAMNTSDIAKALNLPTTPVVLSKITAWLNVNHEPRRTMVKGVRNAWLMPIPDNGHSALYLREVDSSDEKG